MGGKPIFRILLSIILGASLSVCSEGSSQAAYPAGSISITNSSGDTIPAASPLTAYVGNTIPIKVYVRTDTHAAEVYANVTFSPSILRVIDSQVAGGGGGAFWDTRGSRSLVAAKISSLYPFLDNATGTIVLGLLASSSPGAITDKKMADLVFRAIKPGISTMGFANIFAPGETICGSFPTAIVKRGVSVLNRVEGGVINVLFNDTPKLSSPANNSESSSARPAFVFTFPDTMPADGYEIQIDTSPAFANGYFVDTASEANPIDTETHVLSSDLPPAMYYWRARAWTNDGVVSGWSDSRALAVVRPRPKR